MKKVTLVCDGACSGNGKESNVGGWGAVLKYKEHEKTLFGGAPQTTNNVMELTAVIEGLSALQSRDLIVDIFSDSAYVVNCFKEKWYVKWQMNGWKTSKKEAVENKDLWERLIVLVQQFKGVNFYKIKGHLNHDKASDLKKWHQKFNDFNHLNYSLDDFKAISMLNHQADALANEGMDLYR